VDIVEDDDDELSDEEGMTPEHTDDELSQAQSSGGRQNAEYVCFIWHEMYNSGVSPFPRRFPSRGPHITTVGTGNQKTTNKSTVQPIVQKYVVCIVPRAAV